jgi:hypothetical protein
MDGGTCRDGDVVMGGAGTTGTGTLCTEGPDGTLLICACAGNAENRIAIATAPARQVAAPLVTRILLLPTLGRCFLGLPPRLGGAQAVG